MPNEQNDEERNRRGCLILAAFVTLGLVLIGLLGFSADPRNRPAEDIPVRSRT
jgi:hypothetical protein